MRQAVTNLPGVKGSAMVKRRDPRGTVPVGGIRPPHRPGPLAVMDLGPIEFACVAWLVKRLEAGEPISARALARELHIGDHAARAFVNGPWREWALFWINESRTQNAGQNVEAKAHAELTEKLRAAVEPHLPAAPSGTSKPLATKAIGKSS